VNGLIGLKTTAAFAAFATTIGLASCVGSALAPSTMPQSPAVQRAAPRASSPCRLKAYYYFRGSCTTRTLPASGGSYDLAVYRGFTLSLGVPKNAGKSNAVITFGDATGDRDITGKLKGKAFPPYPKPCGGNACPGTAFLYFVLAPSVQVKMSGKTTFTVVNAGKYPGKECIISVLNIMKWFPLTAPVKPKGNTLRFSVADSEYMAAPVAGSISCS
jgi:hypothetical protein